MAPVHAEVAEGVLLDVRHGGREGQHGWTWTDSGATCSRRRCVIVLVIIFQLEINIKFAIVIIF